MRAGIIIDDLVVVPGGDPRTGGMARLQVRIRLVERIARAVLLEAVRRGTAMLAHVVLAPGRLVDVVAEKSDQVRLVGGDVAAGVVPDLLVLLAGSERKAQPRGGRGRGRGGAPAAESAVPAARAEPGPTPTNHPPSPAL